MPVLSPGIVLCGAGQGGFPLVISDFGCPGWWQQGLSAHSPALSAFPHPCFVWDDPSSLSSFCAVEWSSGAGAGHSWVSPDVPKGCHTPLHSDSSSPWAGPVSVGSGRGWGLSGQCRLGSAGLGKLLSLLCGNPCAEPAWRLPLAGLWLGTAVLGAGLQSPQCATVGCSGGEGPYTPRWGMPCGPGCAVPS